ncbi:MAG: hypothetical protein PHX58_10145 [Desulfovibrio sp.]|nr:hypothetical protein [Desulfovibrio sp.]
MHLNQEAVQDSVGPVTAMDPGPGGSREERLRRLRSGRLVRCNPDGSVTVICLGPGYDPQSLPASGG